MSQPNTVNQNFPNGIPPHLNGTESSHSSRDPSPSTRMYPQISSAQPPAARVIPSSQLPPSKQPVSQLAHNLNNLQMNHLTPLSSPKMQTSTPEPPFSKIELKSRNFTQTDLLSPILTSAGFTHSATSQFSNAPFNNIEDLQPKQIPSTTTAGFTHSASSHFSNVPLNSGEDPVRSKIGVENHAQLTSQRTAASQSHVPSLQQHYLPQQNSLPNNALPPRPPLQSTLSQPRLMAYNDPPLLQNFSSKNDQNTQSNSKSVSQQQYQQQQPNKLVGGANYTPHSQNNVIGPMKSMQGSNPFNQSPATTLSSNQPPSMSAPMTPSHIPMTQNDTPISSQIPMMPTTSNQSPMISNQILMGRSKPSVQPSMSAPITPSHEPMRINQQPINQATMVSNQGPMMSNQVPMGINRVPMVSNQVPMISNQIPMASTLPPRPMHPSQPPIMAPNLSNAPVMPLNQPTISSNQSHQPPPMVPNQHQRSVNQPPGLFNQPPRPNQPLGVKPNAPPMHNQNVNNGTNNAMLPQTNVNNPYNMPPQQQQFMTQNNVNNIDYNTQPQQKMNLHTNRYPQQQQQQQQFNVNPMQQPQSRIQQQQPLPQQNSYQNYPPQPQSQQQQQTYNQNPYNYQQQQQNVVQSGYNKLWGNQNVDLLQSPNILPPTRVETPQVTLGNELLDAANCHPDIFRCTMTKIPESNALLQKSRLPLGVLIHPFRDLSHLPVIQCNTIVRCRACRTYINPFVFFVDNKRWKCNLCYRVNELPEEFQYDPVTKTYGDPSRRPEVKTSTIEFIAPAEYMLRPPQPAVYLFLLDISRGAIESGYLQTVCDVLTTELSNLPGDARTHIGFIAYDSALHFFSLAEGLSQPHEMTVLDVDDIFLPCPDNLLVNLQDRMELVTDLLAQLPNRYNNSFDTGSALGAALQAAHKMMASTGGRVTVFQATLPAVGPGALIAREDPSQRAGSEVQHLNPATDFYKRLALECSGQQIAVDLFLVNSQYVDLATVSGISRFSGGCMYHFPLFKASRTLQNESFSRTLHRYLTRKIGFEAVMRIRCTRGLSIHTFHGNFFVRSTDLLSLPNVNPDAGFGMQVAIEENLSDVQTVCFQAALLYTSSKGERRIRVHTMCLPVVNNLNDVINAADQQCIIGLLSKMAVDRSMQSNLSDAREAFINVAIDILSSYKLSQNMGSGMSGLLAPNCLRLLPLYISALLKNIAFRTGVSTRLDDRVKAMCDMKTRPLPYLIQQVYPDLYPIHNLLEQATVPNDEDEPVHMPPHLQLTARSIDSNGAYLLDMGDQMVIIVCPAVSNIFLTQVLGVTDYNSITDQMYDVPILENEHNSGLHVFMNYLNSEKPMNATLQVMRDNSQLRGVFLEKFIEDRNESTLSYHEFLQHLKTQVK